MENKTYYYIVDSQTIERSFLYRWLVQLYTDDITPNKLNAKNKTLDVFGELISSIVVGGSSYHVDFDVFELIHLFADSVLFQTINNDLLKQVLSVEVERLANEVQSFLKEKKFQNNTIFNYATVDETFSIWFQYSG